MTRKCFFVEAPVEAAEDLVLTGQVARHICSVLRLRPGEGIELRDQRGRAWDATITALEQGAVKVRVDREQPLTTESPLDLSLALGYSRSDRMELVLRQATELGVNRFLAFRSERSQYGLTGAAAANKARRWLKIAREAVCQCGRGAAPEIVLLADVEECLQRFSARDRGEDERSLKILALEHGTRENLLELRQRFPAPDRVLVVVGPEGGWTAAEAERFIREGFHPVCLGPRVLRLETAAGSLLAAVQLLWGDLARSQPRT